MDTSYEREIDELEQGKEIFFRRNVSTVNAGLVLFMDVLEHLEDDVHLLSQYVEKVPRGARFLISVPAFQFLWSEHDVFLEHKRRYRLSELLSTVKRSGLIVEKSAYYFGFVFPLAVMSRLTGKLLRSNKQPPRSQLTKHSVPVDTVLGAICKAELPLLGFNRFAGLTAFCLARRP